MSERDARPRGVTGHITGTAFLWHPTDLPWEVSFFAIHKALPIYHDPNGSSGREDEGEDGSYVFRIRTKCGLVSYEDRTGPGGKWVDASDRSLDDRIPSRHAVRFAKPCLNCWPEVREVIEDGEPS